MTSKFIISFALFLISSFALSQSGSVSFLAMINGSTIHQLDSATGDIKTLKFYISGLSFSDTSGRCFQPKKQFHLIDFESSSTTTIQVDFPNDFTPSQINFSVGIDSITNVSGVMGGDLDPTKGMYWTWQSGYINFKLETSKITYHLGGYASPYPTLQHFSFKINNQHPRFVFDADKFLSLALLQRKTNIMSTGADAYHFAQYLQNVFSLKE